jgi:predicted nuclease of predicted toxin-antitoxin system
MKIVADENVQRPIVKRLREGGHDVTFILETAPGSKDQDILRLAAREGALLITCDKDFRQLAIEARRQSSGVLLLRIDGPPPQEQANLVAETIQAYGSQLHRAFTTLYLHDLKMEPLPEEHQQQ